MTALSSACETFWRHLAASRLLSPAQLHAARACHGTLTEVGALAHALVADRTLTSFQAKVLCAGKKAAFHFGPYRLLDKLGSGGMGRVFLARHETMQRRVALKLLAPHLVQTERARQFFRREIRAVARLNHPNIVLAYDAGTMAGRHYLAMEYVDGPTFGQLVRRRGPLPVAVACELIRQTALGLQHAHEQGIVHRDIKPSNILLSCGRAGLPGQVKILDFGMARLPTLACVAPATVTATASDAVMGTPDYLSPEQARSLDAADIRSDLYSLGCTLYFLLTGQVPFPGGTTTSKLIRHGSAAATPLTALRADVPPAVAGLVERLMAKRPEERYATPAEVVAALTPHAAPSCGWAPGRSGEQPLPTADAPTDANIDTAPHTALLVGTAPPASRGRTLGLFAVGLALGIAASASILLGILATRLLN